MSVEMVVICDGCGVAMAGAKTAAAARRDARNSGFDARTAPGGKDYCADCRASSQRDSGGAR